MKVKILISGGTGFVGKALVKRLLVQQHKVYLLSRQPKMGEGALQYVVLPPGGGLLPMGLVSQMDAVVNLAGHNISAGRWTTKTKELILNSRLQITRQLVDSLARNQQAGQPYPKILVNASAVGYYGTHPTQTFDESSASGEGFLAQVCREWEESAQGAEKLGVRVVLMRLGVVLGSGGGALAKMALPYTYGIGGTIGSGQQWCSWVHREDVVRFIALALAKSGFSGAYNLCSPQPVTMQEFNQLLAVSLGKKAWTRLPAPMARLLLGEMAQEMLLNGQRVLPKRLLASGYRFQYPSLSDALQSIRTSGT